MVIQLFAVIRSGVATLIVMSMDDDHLLILGVAGHAVAGSADIPVAPLRGRWRIIDHHIVHEPNIQITTNEAYYEVTICFLISPFCHILVQFNNPASDDNHTHVK